MKKRKLILLIIFISIIIVYISNLRFVKTEPLTIRVLDNDTKESLSNITVYYQITKIRSNYLAWSADEISLTIKKLVTDSNGQITIPSKTFLLNKSILTLDELSSLFIFINIDKKNKRNFNYRDIEDFTECILFEKQIVYDNIYFVNPTYAATGMFIFNASNETETRIEMKRNFIVYYTYTSFDEYEEMKVDVMLARNK